MTDISAIAQRGAEAEALAARTRALDMRAAPAYAATGAPHPWLDVLRTVLLSTRGAELRGELAASPRTPLPARAKLAAESAAPSDATETTTPTSITAVGTPGFIDCDFLSIARCLEFDENAAAEPLPPRVSLRRGEVEVAGETGAGDAAVLVEQAALRRIAALLPDHLSVTRPATMAEYAAARVVVARDAVAAARGAAAAAALCAAAAHGRYGAAARRRAGSDARAARDGATTAARTAASCAEGSAAVALRSVARAAQYLRVSVGGARARAEAAIAGAAGVYMRNAARSPHNGAPVYTREGAAGDTHLYRGSGSRWCVAKTVAMLAGNTFGAIVRAAAPSDAPLGAEWGAACVDVRATTRAQVSVLFLKPLIS